MQSHYESTLMPDQIKSRLFGFADLAMLITTVCWGLNFVITKMAAGPEAGQLQIFIYNLIRFPIAAALLFITAHIKGEKVFPGRRAVGQMAGLAFVGIFLYQTTYMIAQTMTQAANIGIIYSFTPLLILLISVMARVEKTTFFTVLGVLLGVTGLMMIVFEGGNLSVDRGALLFVFSVFCWACYGVFGKPVLDKYPPVITTAWVLTFGSLYQAPFAAWQVGLQEWGAVSGTSVLLVLLSALLSLYTGYTLFYYAVSRIGPTRTGIFLNLTPIFTLIFASLLRHEAIRAVQIAGLTVIITGIFVAKIRPGGGK